MTDEGFLAVLGGCAAGFVLAVFIMLAAPEHKRRYQARKAAYEASIVHVDDDGTVTRRVMQDGHVMLKSKKTTYGVFGDSVSVSFAHHPECPNPSHQ